MRWKLNIREILSYFVIICLTFTLTACNKQQNTKETEKGEEFQIKVAQNLVNVYMNALMKEDMEGAKKLYSKELSQKTKEAPKSNLKVKGYSIEESSEVGRSGFFRVKVARMALDSPSAVLDEASIKIIKENNNYKINEVKTETQKEAFMEKLLGQEILRIRNKNNLKTNLLMAPESLPQYTFSKDDKGNLIKEPVPQNKLSVINFGYGGERIAVSSYDKNSYIGIIKIDESMAAQGGSSSDQSGGGGGQGGNGGGQGGQQGGSMFMETPIGKQMTSLDLIRDAKVEFMTFSDGEKFIVVQYNKSNIGRCIRVYNVDSGELIPVNFEETYSLGKVEVVFSSFDKDVLNYEVIQKDMNDKTAKEQAGKYQISLEKFKIKRL